MKKYLVLVLLVLSVTAGAQDIKGKVCFEKDKAPVQFASVALLHLPDSGMITGVITLTDGGYIIEKVEPGSYFIKSAFVGYKSAGKEVQVQEGKPVTEVDTIFLAEYITALNEVTVTGERLKGKEMVDRTVYAIPEVVTKSSTNGYDILKKIPQVNVDFQNNITLNGSSNFIIQVDGRKRDREFLARLLPSDIQSVEIISNPSGKYEGNIDGVINIILKKEARYGLSGNAGLSIKPFNKVTSALTGSLDYSAGKITFYITAMNFSQSLNLKTGSQSSFSMIDSTENSSGNGHIKVGMSTVNTGFDYYINDKNNLSFNINFKPIHQDVGFTGGSELLKNNVPLNTVSSMTNNLLKSDEASASMFYKRTFAKPVEEFTAELSYYIFDSKNGSDFVNSRYQYGSDLLLNTYARVQDDINSRKYLSGKLDFVYPLGMYAKFETGYQVYFQNLDYDFNIDHQEQSNLFAYNEIRNSLYGGLTMNYKKFGVQALLRVENSQVKADSVIDPSYSCFLPSANLQYKLSASHNLKFTYNRRINRPGIYDMNPYWKTNQNYSISQGNPDLKPDYRDRLQLTYTWNFGSNYFSPYVYDEFFKDKIGSRYSIIQSPVNGSMTTFTKPFNLLNGYEMGGGINAMLWYVNINARIYKGHLDEYKEPGFVIPSRDYFSYAITSYAFANLDKKKKTTVFLFLSYNGVNINAQSKTFNLPLYGIGTQYQIKNHNLGIFWLLPFSHDVRFNRVVTETPAFSSTNTTTIDIANYIQFSYSYKFNRGKNVKKIAHRVEVESDSKTQAVGR